MSDTTSIQPMTIAESKARRKNSIAIALVLGALVALFYAVTLVRLQDNVARNQAATAAAMSGAGATASAPGSR